MTVEEAPLGLDERVANAIRLGESHFREFKSALAGERTHARARQALSICRDVADAPVAFANADGGELLIGVEDDGSVTGVLDEPDYIESIMKASETHVHRDTPLAPLKARVAIDGKLVIYFQVEKGTRYVHLTSDGRCLQRRDRATVPVASEHIRFERQEQISREYDRGFVESAHVGDLDTELIERVATQIAGDMSAEKCLQVLNLAEYAGGIYKVRKAALLLFARDIEHWHPRCEVRIVRVKGTEIKTAPEYNAQNFGIARGNILVLYSKAWEILRSPGLLVETKFSADGRFEERIMYPEDAVREALVNAIAHRDYAIEGRGIEVVVFDDRMELRSPGAPLSTISISDLRKQTGVHESRNAFVARTLRELGYMREMGEGLRRIYYLMRIHDLVAPDLQADHDSFTITLHHQSVFSEADQRWIDSFEGFNLTKEEKLVVLLGKAGQWISPQQIWDTLDLVDTEVYRSIVYGLQIKGILVTEMPKNQATQEARRKHVSVREIGRFRIRAPQECEKDLAQLLQSLRTARPGVALSNPDVQKALRSLPETNLFRRSAQGLSPIASMKALGLTDEARRPAGRLLAFLTSTRTPRTDAAAPAPGKEGNNARPSVPRAVELGAEELEQQEEVRDIYVGNLEYGTTPGEVEEIFRQHGAVVRVTVPTDYYTGQNRGFAFVSMAKLDDARRALEELDGSYLRGRRIHLGWSTRQ